MNISPTSLNYEGHFKSREVKSRCCDIVKYATTKRET